MSKNYNRARFKKARNNQQYRKLYLMWLYPPYYDEGWTWRNPNLPNHKWREFRTWKHTRRNQWKE